MFNMIVEKQMNIIDRTLLLGVPEFDKIPNRVFNDNKEFKVFGVSFGVKLPYLSLEIEKTSENLINRVISD